MRTIKLIQLLLLLFLILNACKKEEVMVPVNGISGKVIHKYTKNPIPGLTIEFVEWRSSAPLQNTDYVIYSTKTDSKGDYKIDVKEVNKNYFYTVRTKFYSVNNCPGDISCKYYSVQSGALLPTSFVPLINFEVEPSAIIECYISQTTWDSLIADTVVVSSPYMTNTLIRGQGNTGFYVEPYQSHLFSWHSTFGGIDGNIFSKNINVQSSPGSIYSYEITF